MTNQKIINFWIKSSDLDIDSMNCLFSGKRYDASLFFGHLGIEKLLKALFVKVNGKDVPIPKTHNLLKLVRMSNLVITKEQEDSLDNITKFNIEARYQDYKLAFYKRCTKQYAGKWKKEIEDLRKWLKNQI